MRKFLFILYILFLALFVSNVYAERIVIKGSTTVLPLAQAVSEQYMKLYPDVVISLSGGGSGNGIKAIVDGSTDIANASRFIKDKEVERAVENNSYPVPFAVGYDCIVPVVHPDNKVKNIKLEDLKKIYQGKIKNWKEIGGDDEKIVIVSRDTSSGTYEVWEKKVMDKQRVTPRATTLASNGSIVQLVSKNKKAIGYIGLGYLNKKLKPLTVNNIEGNEATTLNGTFPISRPLFMFTRGWPTGKIKDFMSFVLDPNKGQKLVKKEGFVPLY